MEEIDWTFSALVDTKILPHGWAIVSPFWVQRGAIIMWSIFIKFLTKSTPDNKVHGANMGPTWVLSAPDGPLVGPMNLAIRDSPGKIWREFCGLKKQRCSNVCNIILHWTRPWHWDKCRMNWPHCNGRRLDQWNHWAMWSLSGLFQKGSLTKLPLKLNVGLVNLV